MDSTVRIAAAGIRRLKEAELLLRVPTPDTVMAVAERADELRFKDPAVAPAISKAAVKALRLFQAGDSLKALTLAIHGSALRSAGDLEKSELALKTAAELAPDPKTRAQVARRLAVLRAEQGWTTATRSLLPAFLNWARGEGPRPYGEALVDAGAALIMCHDFAAAQPLTSRALSFLPANGDSYHLAAIFNLSRCCIELSSHPSELAHAASLVEAAELLLGDDYTATKMMLLKGQLYLQACEPSRALNTFEKARPKVEVSNKPIDLAILLVNIAVSHLGLSDSASASQVLLEGFPLLRHLKGKPEAFQALRAAMRAAEQQEIDVELLLAARKALESS